MRGARARRKASADSSQSGDRAKGPGYREGGATSEVPLTRLTDTSLQTGPEVDAEAPPTEAAPEWDRRGDIFASEHDVFDGPAEGDADLGAPPLSSTSKRLS